MTAAMPVHAPATIGRRIAAYLIDYAVGVIVLLVAVGVFAGIAVASGGGFPLPLAALCGYAVLLGWLLVYTAMQGGAGSIGMRALGLALVRVEDDGRLGFARSLGRNLVWALGSAIIAGAFSPLFDASPWRRGWHDRASGAVMTDVTGRGAAPAPPEADVETADLARAASAPATLPAAAILPSATELHGWTPAAADARPPVREAGVIAFVPGISGPERLDPPAPSAPAIPVVDAAPAPPAMPAMPASPAGQPASTATPSASRMPEPSASAPRDVAVGDDLLEQTRLPAAERPLARLVWDDGTRQAVYGRTVFGRNPAPESGAMVVPIRDETLSLSKTHFELAADDDRALWVIDRHSTNGVTVRRGSQHLAAVPGERTRVRMGDVLEFGDRSVTIEVAS